MFETRLTGNIARNALPLALITVGLGWLLFSRASAPASLAGRAREVGQSLRRALDSAGEWRTGLIARAAGVSESRTPGRIVRRKIGVHEPMAGYGG